MPIPKTNAAQCKAAADQCKACCPTDLQQRMDALGFDWTALITYLPELLAILEKMLAGKTPAAGT